MKCQKCGRKDGSQMKCPQCDKEMDLYEKDTSSRRDTDLPRDAGEERWELVAVLPNGMAYLKRDLDDYDAVERKNQHREKMRSQLDTR
jgi:hypothetical protein